MNSCIFCKIAAKQIPSNLLYESDRVLAFPDIGPQAPVHLLIIPKAHYAHLGEIPDEQLGVVEEMFTVARKLAADKGVQDRGYRLVMNVNPEGGQTVFHVHLHLLAGRPMGPSLIG
ncbi:MAG: histidine triad nucleotide-binding protein [Deltaproteobacteria bacterium]|nr:histidine triad nucleotide-binding protein [Deltaproteobacteria bacterium]